MKKDTKSPTEYSTLPGERSIGLTDSWPRLSKTFSACYRRDVHGNGNNWDPMGFPPTGMGV